MATLIILQQKSRWMPALPHKLLINGRLVGIMQTERTQVELPAGTFNIRIQSMLPMLSASRTVHIDEGVTNTLRFADREKWWDALFMVDLVLWAADFFFTLPQPWDTVYQICTNGFFALWLIYEWCIHKKYFRLEFFQSRMPSAAGPESAFPPSLSE